MYRCLQPKSSCFWLLLHLPFSSLGTNRANFSSSCAGLPPTRPTRLAARTALLGAVLAHRAGWNLEPVGRADWSLEPAGRAGWSLEPAGRAGWSLEPAQGHWSGRSGASLGSGPGGSRPSGVTPLPRCPFMEVGRGTSRAFFAGSESGLLSEPTPGFASTEVFLGGPSFGPPKLVGVERDVTGSEPVTCHLSICW